MIPWMYLPFERNNGEELKNLILYQGFFFQVSSPTFQKRIQSKIPSNKQRNKVSLNIKSWKKKKERKTSASLKLVTLISYPLNNSSMNTPSPLSFILQLDRKGKQPHKLITINMTSTQFSGKPLMTIFMPVFYNCSLKKCP